MGKSMSNERTHFLLWQIHLMRIRKGHLPFQLSEMGFLSIIMQQMGTLPCFKIWFLCVLYWGKVDALRIDKFDLIFNKMARNSLKQVISYHIFHCRFVRVVLILFLSSLQRGRRNISWRIGAAEQLYILSSLILVWEHALLAVGLSSEKKRSVILCVWNKLKNCV